MTTPIMGVEFANPSYPALGLEAMVLSDLLRRCPSGHFLRPQRPAFHALLLFSAGRGWHRLDFETVPCGPGTAIHVRPGQVQQFDCSNGLEASLVLFRPDFVPPEPSGLDATLLEIALPEGRVQMRDAGLECVADGFASLAREYARIGGSHSGEAILRHLLCALLLRMAKCGTPDAADGSASAYPRIYRQFRRSLERGFVRRLKIGGYAQDLGVSEKTLARACIAMAGLPPARLIEARVLLEARRLLAHTDLPAASVAGQLGFDEPTNFTKFFRRLTGTTPIRFRAGLWHNPIGSDRTG